MKLFATHNFLISSLLLTAAVLQSCTDYGDQPSPEIPPIVIEGWIEDMRPPIVILTHAVDMNASGVDLEDCVEKWARVTIDDGSGPVIMNTEINHDYFPPVIYTTSKVKGRCSVTYRLTVETDDHFAVAVATIPPKATRIKKLIQQPVAGNDSLVSLTAMVDVDPQKEGYYKFFTKAGSSEKRYYSSFLGTFSSSDYISDDGWKVQKGIHDTFNDNFIPFFQKGDTVSVKFCTMEKVAYDFWQAYESVVSTGDNLIFSANLACPTNIEGNARGYWHGYAVSYGKTIIK